MNFSATREQLLIIQKIAQRAITLSEKLGLDYADNLQSIIMDLDATISNGNPLKLEELLAADNTNFLHDVFGICKNINRVTGKLEHFFSPRYSK